MSEPSKQTRARSRVAKEKQFLRIIEVGRNSFLKYGSEGMKMRTLAKDLGSSANSASSLYTYVSSKRELWFAIIKHYFKAFELGMEDIARNHRGSAKQLLLKIADFYLHFAFEDSHRYRMMFQTPAPLSEKIGPIERAYESRSTYILKSIVTQAIRDGEFKETDAGKLAIFLWGILHGPVVVAETELFGSHQAIPNIGVKEQYLQFLKEKIARIIEVL